MGVFLVSVSGFIPSPLSNSPTKAEALTCAEGGVCVVGDIGPGGGRVFYVHTSGTFTSTGSECDTSCRYLEAAPRHWLEGTLEDPVRTWAQASPVNYQESFVGVSARGTAIGTGHGNTTAIIQQGNNDPSSSAAQLARSYTGGGFTDWYLPAHNELALVRNNRAFIGTTSVPTDRYWTSSELVHANPWVWVQNFSNGTFNSKTNPGKMSLYKVRPIRAFEPSSSSVTTTTTTTTPPTTTPPPTTTTTAAPTTTTAAPTTTSTAAPVTTTTPLTTTTTTTPLTTTTTTPPTTTTTTTAAPVTTTTSPTITTTAAPATTTTSPTTTTMITPRMTAPPRIELAVSPTTTTFAETSIQQQREVPPVVAVVATTAAPRATTSTSQAPPDVGSNVAPIAPEVMLGAAKIMVGDDSSSVLVTKSDTEINISGGGIISSFYGRGDSGDALVLDANGNLHLDNDDEISVRAYGYAPNSSVELWMFSSPTKLTSVFSDARGAVEVRAAIPATVQAGNHRLVVEGTNDDGDLVVIALGITYGEPDETLFSASRLTGFLLLLAIFFGLFLPRTMRRLRVDTL